MTTLYQQLELAGVNDIGLTPQEQLLLEEFCDRYQELFDNACNRHPEKSPSHMLLGTLTHAHVELSSMLQEQLEALLNMKRVIDESLEEEYRERFRPAGPEELLLLTKLWVMVQGYLRMDFSLANDHAAQSASLVNHLLGANPTVLQESIMQCFTAGQQHSPEPEQKPGWFSRLLHFMAGKPLSDQS